MVLWRDYAKLNVTREFFDVSKVYNDGTPIEEPIGDSDGSNP